MMHKARSSIEEVPYCFLMSSVKFQGHTAKKILILTQIRRFRTVTAVSIHWWLLNDAQKKTWSNIQYEPKKICRRAAECGRLLSAANHRLPTPSGNGRERQTPVIFTPQAVLDPMLQTMMDPGTTLPVIPLHESQVTTTRLTGGISFRSLHMYALCTLYTSRIK